MTDADDGGRSDVFDGKDEELSSNVVSYDGSRILLSARVVAAKMQNGSIGRVDIQGASGIVSDQNMLFSDPIGMTAGLQQGFEAGVQFVYACQIVQEALVDPQFAACEGFVCFDFELARSSPLVDAGDDDPPGGLSDADLAGKPRVIGPHVDIGAYENDRLLADGFEP